MADEFEVSPHDVVGVGDVELPDFSRHVPRWGHGIGHGSVENTLPRTMLSFPEQYLKVLCVKVV